MNKVKLGDCIELIIDNRGKTPPLAETGYELIETASINGSNKYPDYSKITKFVSEETYNTWFRKGHPTSGDILISTVGMNIGDVVIMKSNRGSIAQNLIALRTNNKLNSDYLYYILTSKNIREKIRSLNIGSAQPSLKVPHLLNIEFYLPNIEKQSEISKILNELDEKIELNTQINQTLEQIAQTIFKSWFIDFDPVHKAEALANGQTAEQATQAAMAVISGKNTQELHRLQTANPEQYQQLWEIAEAFPSGFDEEGVPRGWEEKFFGELLENTIGGDWGKDEVDEKHTEKVSILRGTDLPDVYKGNDKDVPTRFVEQKKLKSRKLQYSDIVIEVSGGSKNQPTGRSLLITDKLLSRFNNPIVPASFCRLFRPKSENYGYLLALHLQIIYQQGKTWEYQNQSTGISNFQTTHFLETEKVILPTNKTLMYFAEMVNPIFDKIYSDENQRLAEIRDELLPKLLSGEV